MEDKENISVGSNILQPQRQQHQPEDDILNQGLHLQNSTTVPVKKGVQPNDVSVQQTNQAEGKMKSLNEEQKDSPVDLIQPNQSNSDGQDCPKECDSFDSCVADDNETTTKKKEKVKPNVDQGTDDDDDDEDDSQLINWEKQKILKIYEAMREDNVEQLVHYCDTNGGLLSNRIRKIVWPKILKSNIIGTYQSPDEDEMQAHFYYRQVVLDVDRSIKRFPPSIKERQRLAMQDQLVRLIMRLLIRNPKIHYYQGFHDICVTILIILGEESAFHAMHSLVNSHLHRYMEKTTDSVALILELIPVLIQRKDQALFEFLERSEVGNIYCLSWVLTWFGHSLTNYRHLGRLFDLFIVNHELFNVYLVASILLYKRDQIMELDCCISEVYPFLNRLIENEEDDLPFEELIENARVLLREYSPESLHKEQQKRIKRKQEQDKLHRKKVAYQISAPFLDRRLVIAATICVASVAIFFVAKGISNHLK